MIFNIPKENSDEHSWRINFSKQSSLFRSLYLFVEKVQSWPDFLAALSNLKIKKIESRLIITQGQQKAAAL
jgi:hypothetical protein